MEFDLVVTTVIVTDLYIKGAYSKQDPEDPTNPDEPEVWAISVAVGAIITMFDVPFGVRVPIKYSF